MAKRIGANRMRKHTEKRRTIGNTMSKAAAKGAKGITMFAMVAGVVGAAIFGAIKLSHWASLSPMFTVATISVIGTSRIDTAEVLKLSGLKTNMKMMTIHSKSVQMAIAKNPWVKSVDVSRHFPNKVVISIKERIPVALVSAKNVFYADNEGMLLPLFNGTYSNLPLLSGITDIRMDSVKCIGGQTFARVKRFLDECRQADPVFAKKISQIDFSSDRLVRMSLEDIPYVVDISDADTKTSMYRLKQLVQSVQKDPRGIPKQINLCYEDLGYVRW